MEVGHTKFGYDRVFGMIRQEMLRVEDLTPDQLKNLIEEEIAECLEGFIFDFETKERDYKSFFRDIVDFVLVSTILLSLRRNTEWKEILKVSTSTGSRMFREYLEF